MFDPSLASRVADPLDVDFIDRQSPERFRMAFHAWADGSKRENHRKCGWGLALHRQGLCALSKEEATYESSVFFKAFGPATASPLDPFYMGATVVSNGTAELTF